ncbi:MAG: SRPBCC family protein, partial [Acidimicrobiia bacterium]|nr:SRPBCC family protein [Acidimicrobiia bacterium]
MLRHQLTTEIEIDAMPERVWEVLTDLDAYESWNPFVVSSAGTVAVGEKLVNRMQPPGDKAR